MDEMNQQGTPSGLPPGLGQTLSKLLSDPELVARIRAAAGDAVSASADIAEDAKEDSAPVGSTPVVDDDLMKKLPGVMSAIAPMLGGTGSKSPSPANDKRAALLLALKPFLSPARCQAVDSIVQFSRLGELLGGLK